MFARKVNIYILRTLVVGLVDVFVLYFVAHYMGPKPLGLIGYALAYINLFMLFSELGFGTAHVKRISEGMDTGKCIGTYATIKIFLISILTIIIITTILVKKYFYNIAFDNPEQEYVIYLLLIPIILTQISLIATKTFEARKEAFKASVSTIISPLVKAPITIAVALLGLGVYGLIFARIIGGVIIVAIPIYYLVKLPFTWPDKESFKSYLSFAYKLFLLTFLVQVSLQIDKLMIGEFISVEAVGIYFSVMSIIAFLNVIPEAVGTLLFPMMSERYSKGDFEFITRAAHLSEKYIGLILIPISMILFYFSPDIVKLLLGHKFQQASLPLSILAIYYLINGLRKPVASQLAGTNNIGLLATLSTISVVTNIILNVLFIPKELFGIKLFGLGINGAAIATLFSGILYSFLCRIAVFRTLKIKPNKRMLYQYFAGFVMILFFYLISSILPVNSLTFVFSIITLIIYALLGVLVFLFVLFLLQEINKDDLLLLFRSLNPGKMKDYVKSEFNND